MAQLIDNRTDQHWENNIEALSEQLGLLKITEKDTSEETTEYTDKISVAPAQVQAQNKQAVIWKSIVLDSE